MRIPGVRLLLLGGLLGANVLVDLMAGDGAHSSASHFWDSLGLIIGGLLTVLFGVRLNRRPTGGP